MKNILSAILSIAAIVTAIPAQSGEFINWQPLIKDSVPGSPGLESIIPRIVLKDSNTDGVEDQAFVSFDVWAGGTRNLLFRTKQRGVNLPASPCTSPVESDVDFEIKFTNETGGRSNIVILFDVVCTESDTFEDKEVYKTLVYSADVTQSPADGGTSWRQAWNSDAISFNNLHWDDDTVKEIILNLVDDQGSRTTVRTIVMTQLDGKVVADTNYKFIEWQ